MALSSPFNGATATGYLTSPTYTVTADLAPSANGKQYAVTALGGTQTDVEVSSVAQPFTLTVFKPTVIRQLPLVNPSTGAFTAPVGRNTFRFIVRKGVVPKAGQSPVVATVDTSISIPAGASDEDPNSVAALLSAAIGALSNQSTDLINMCRTGVVTF
jgi:hypothetical protein